MNVGDKVAGNTYLATEFTPFKNEVQNLIAGSGLILSSGSATQAREAAMRYVTAGRDCVASGTGNAIVLTTRTPFVDGAPSILQAGATYSALITSTNTLAVTVNINGTGVIDVTKDGFTNPLAAGDIAVPALYDFVISADSTKAELVAKMSSVSVPDASETVKGIIEIANDTEKLDVADNTHAMTPKQVQTTALGGAGQTRVDKTGGRSIGTPYTNTTEAPIVIIVGCTSTANSANIAVTIGGVIEYSRNDASGQSFTLTSSPIQVGEVYTVTTNNATYTSWYEITA